MKKSLATMLISIAASTVNAQSSQMTLPIPASILPIGGLDLAPVSRLLFDYTGGLPSLPGLPLLPGGDVDFLIAAVPYFIVPDGLLKLDGVLPTDIPALSGPIHSLLGAGGEYGAGGESVLDLGLDGLHLVDLNNAVGLLGDLGTNLETIGILPLLEVSVFNIFDGGPLTEDGIPVIGVLLTDNGLPLLNDGVQSLLGDNGLQLPTGGLGAFGDIGLSSVGGLSGLGGSDFQLLGILGGLR
ncbi:MAG: hypothetical protein P1U47_12375 [Zhongshania sp.]|uniref:hypothetical protein n=1 Tax=Zhongshania sp. TaxID=1971902 RepID=UPI002623C007|nr:hypothetical protein [Zhongshania sp.]MDF1693167.1 hypothetical protein [Zhongshania sp.]